MCQGVNVEGLEAYIKTISDLLRNGLFDRGRLDLVYKYLLTRLVDTVLSSRR